MGMFLHLEGEAAVLAVKGGYKQCPMYERNGYLYAKVNGKFVRLMADGSTTDANIRLDELTWERGALFTDGMGRLCRASVEGCKALPAEKMLKLAGTTRDRALAGIEGPD